MCEVRETTYENIILADKDCVKGNLASNVKGIKFDDRNEQ